MEQQLTVALVAHDDRMDDLLTWAKSNRDALARFRLVASGTTGQLLGEALDLPVERMRSRPLGGDLQIGAAIAEGRMDMLVFFWEPLTGQHNEPLVKALLRIAVLRDIPTACDRDTADHFMASQDLVFGPSAGVGPVARGRQAVGGHSQGSTTTGLRKAANGWRAAAESC